MRIDHLTIENFNGFAHRTFNFDPHFNLLVGDNATGKTSVIDALAVAVGSWFLGLRGIEKSLGIDADEVRLAAHQHLDSYTFEKQFPSRIECSGVVMGQRISWTRELQHQGGRTTTVSAKAISEAASEAERRVMTGEDITLPLICTYGTERRWVEKVHYASKSAGDRTRRKPSRLDGYRDCLNSTIQERALLNWIRDQTTAPLPLKQDTVALRVVKSAIIRCVEGAASLDYDGRYDDLVVLLDERPQLLKNLSDGQRVMLTLVGDLASRAAILNPHLADAALQETPGVVMVDELDLHLHPKWQRRMIHDLKTTFPSLQFITTTHSPQLVGEAQPGEILLLDGEVTTSPPRSFGIDSSRILEEVMGTKSRDGDVEDLLGRLFRSIDAEDFDGARRLLVEVETKLGPDDPEATRARALMTFLESKV
ncbi:MAG TPA: AAA family ATPase [Bryobacteraceae bacterium]|jgi:predicted ATP-binding protein involved in virulence